MTDSIEAVRLFKKDILIEPIKKNDAGVHNSSIIVVERQEQQEKLNYFRVLKVADGVTDVKPGEIVLVGYGDHTTPFDLNGKLVAISDVMKVVGVLSE